MAMRLVVRSVLWNVSLTFVASTPRVLYKARDERLGVKGLCFKLDE